MRAKFLIIGGSVTIIAVLIYVYYIFLVPKVGPIGDGTIATPIYVTIISSFFCGTCAIIQGILILKRQKTS
ncbi:hypothetical protein JNUCC23_10790 [Peribacillus sp. JNUCC 23]